MLTLTPTLAERYLLGRTIVLVEIEVVDAEDTNSGLSRAYAVQRFGFDDGSSVTFSTVELHCEYATEVVRHKPGK